MGDILFIAITIAFFALATGFVKLCDRIIGPDDEALPAGDTRVLDEVTP